MTKHLLLIGCTGMLSAAAQALAEQADHATVVGRDLDRARAAAPDARIVVADWTRPDEMIACLEERVAVDGRFDLAVLWIHRAGAELWDRLPALMIRECRVFEVKGSASSDPSKLLVRDDLFACHRRVMLGHKLTDRGQRWLTHEEISNGVLHAIRADRSMVVGELQ